LTLIITPVDLSSVSGILFLTAAPIFGMASKYLLAIGKKHIFNPAAIAIFLTGITLGGYASWWIGGNLYMAFFVLVGGFLITRKVQRTDLVATFIIAAIFTEILTSPNTDPLQVLQRTLLHTPLLFFAFIMITEPLTTPPTRPLRVAYGAFVGILFAPAVRFGPIYSTPELALIIGNIYSYILSPKLKEVLILKEKIQIGTDIYDFVFTPRKQMRFQPGQYLEWTLPHRKADDRGNRRYFTIASSPTERDLRLGVRFYDKASSFKKNMLAMAPDQPIVASQLAGDFVLPKDKTKKLVFIAGGIGITPFRSMLKYLIDNNEKRSVTLLYSNRSADEVIYKDVFDEAEQKIGSRTVYILTNNEERISAAKIKTEVPDYKERLFYISGTYSMVTELKKILRELGVPKRHVKTDFFPGFA
jgi:ferredoxin-NADP reductase